MSTPGNTGPLGQPRGVGFGILMYIVTFGLYSLYWVYKTQEEMRQHTGEGLGGVLGLVVWLLINLGTAILAASVIGVFEGSIQTLAALAVFMPIVASMGGIGTTQTSTLVIRGLALGELTAPHVQRVLRKELWLSLTTGATNAAVMMAIAYLWKRQLLLSLILGAALVLNMLVAAVVGVLVPVALKTFRIDPAIASSVIITTFTDVFGFFSFLGLATLLIRFLL